MSEPATTPAECQTCGHSDRGCCVVTQLIGGTFQSRWLCAEPPDTHGSTERHSPPTSAAPFFRALPFALAGSLPLWALILLLARWAA